MIQSQKIINAEVTRLATSKVVLFAQFAAKPFRMETRKHISNDTRGAKCGEKLLINGVNQTHVKNQTHRKCFEHFKRQQILIIQRILQIVFEQRAMLKDRTRSLK